MDYHRCPLRSASLTQVMKHLPQGIHITTNASAMNECLDQMFRPYSKDIVFKMS